MLVTMENIPELLEDVRAHKHCACQFIDVEGANRKQLVDKICAGIDSMDGDTKYVRLNEGAYKDFASFLKAFLLQMMEDPDFTSGRRRFSKEEVEAQNDEVELCFYIESVFNSSKRHYYILLILEDHQASPDYWTETNYGWMRGLFCEYPLVGALLTTSKDAYSVSPLPYGSSPFANIFDLF